MQVTDLKKLLFSTCQKFFGTTNMIWVGETSGSPSLPLVTLRADSLNKATFPFDVGFDEDGQFIEFYNADIMFEVKGYTQGYVGDKKEGWIQSAENTVLNDLRQFADYIASADITKQLDTVNVHMIQEGPVRDTSIAKSGSRQEYSAMVEYKVDFVLDSRDAGKLEKNTLTKSAPDIEDTGYFETVNEIEGEIK